MKGIWTFLIGVAVGWLIVPRIVPIFKMSLGQVGGQFR